MDGLDNNYVQASKHSFLAVDPNFLYKLFSFDVS